MNYSAVVVDDSHIQRIATTFLVQHHPQLQLSGDFECPLDGIRFAMAQNADLLFLDVLYEDNNIFQVLEELNPDIDIIFNSSWAHFQKDTVEFTAAGFLKKPMRRLDFEECVNKWIYQKESRNHITI